MDDIAPFSEDIDPLLAVIRNPESLPLAFQAVHNYRVRMQDLLDAAKRAEAERADREVRLNVFAGYTAEAARKIAFNDLAFFRAELASELHLSVKDARDRLRKTLRRLIEDETE